jgi:biopolymer transport protein ExbB
MKQSLFLGVAILVTLVVAFVIYQFILGNPNNFANGEVRTVPSNLLGTVYTGGWVVPVLICLTLLDLTLVFERTFTLRKANGRHSITQFLKSVQSHLMNGRIDDAMKACDAQRGSDDVRPSRNGYRNDPRVHRPRARWSPGCDPAFDRNLRSPH